MTEPVILRKIFHLIKRGEFALCIPGDLKRVERILELHFYLSNLRFGRTVEELAERFGVHARTVRRDLALFAAMRFLNLVKETRPDKKAIYRIKREELEVVFYRKPVYRKLAQSIGSEDMEARGKFSDEIQEAQKVNIINLPKKYFRRIYDTDESNLLGKIVEAISNSKICKLSYHDGKKLKKSKIVPIHLMNFKNTIYVLAQDVSDKTFKIISPKRVKDFEVTPEHFKPKEELDKSGLQKLLEYLTKSKNKPKGFKLKGILGSVSGLFKR